MGKISKEDFKNDVKGLLSHIEINNSDVPIPILEEGIESVMYMKENLNYTTEDNTNKGKENAFANINDGLYTSNTKRSY